MKMMKVGDWGKARQTVPGLGKKVLFAQAAAMNGEATLYKQKVKEAFRTRGRSNGIVWKDNAPGTIRNKGGRNTPLIDTGQLSKSITVKKGKLSVWVGIPNIPAVNSKLPLNALAEVHEYGKIIIQSRGGKTVIIKIPARSFLQSTQDAHFQKSEVAKRYLSRVAKSLGGIFAFGNRSLL